MFWKEGSLRSEARLLLQRLRLPLGPRRSTGLVGPASWPDGRIMGAVSSGLRVRRLMSLAAVMRLHSHQVYLITRRQTWLFQLPSSLTHPLLSGAWWRVALKDGVMMMMIRREAAHSSQHQELTISSLPNTYWFVYKKKTNGAV